MVMNVVRAGGYAMMLNELVNQVKAARRSKVKTIRRDRTRNLVIGAGIGIAVGGAVGVLFAPKSGKETRKIIADKAGETMTTLKENVEAAKDRISASAAAESARLREAGQKGLEAAKETLKKQDEEKKK